jgi:hypothetical protein
MAGEGSSTAPTAFDRRRGGRFSVAARCRRCVGRKSFRGARIVAAGCRILILACSRGRESLRSFAQIEVCDRLSAAPRGGVRAPRKVSWAVSSATRCTRRKKPLRFYWRNESRVFPVFFFRAKKFRGVDACLDGVGEGNLRPPWWALAGNYFCKVVDIVKTRD